MEKTRTQPIRISLTEKALEISKQRRDAGIVKICRKILCDYRIGKKSESQCFQKVYAFLDSVNS